MVPSTLINVKNLGISFQQRKLLEGLSFSVQTGQLLALIGANGCGKSTVLRVLHARKNNNEEPDNDDISLSGDISKAPNLEVALLPQSLRTPGGIWSSLTDPSPEPTGLEGKLVCEFGLDDYLSPADQLSEGQLQKRALVHTLLADCDLYLFDEPTNYLDITGITAFEQHVERLKRGGKGIILVTHDRTLTDNLADRTVFITPNGIYQSAGGGSAVWSLKNADLTGRNRSAGEIRRKIRQLQEDMRSKAGWSAKKEKQKIGAKGAKGHISRLSAKMAKRSKTAQKRAEQQIEKLAATKPFVPKQLNLRFPDYKIRKRQVFSLRETCFSYGQEVPLPDPAEKFLLDNISLAASTRDKICLMGANGSGKTTLLKLIQGEITPLSGDHQLNKGVKLIRLPQGLVGFYHRERLLDNFDQCNESETTIRRYLGAALIRREKVRDPITEFSYGELMRAAVVMSILQQAEFLLLDEPTCHLDIESIEVLEQLLQDFKGGFLVISHDRRFVENVAHKLYLLDGGRLTVV